jgi:short-subunit dehydrogenase
MNKQTDMPFAVITGATQGIGKAIAEKFLKEGFSVAVCARNREDLEQLEAGWKSEFPNRTILCLQADLSEKDQVKAFAQQVLAATSDIDVLVNNAGLFFPGNLADEPEGHLEELMRVNLFSAYHLTRALLPAMKSRKKGHIFNMCSVASLKAYKNGGAYSITKYALQGFSDNLRFELIPDRIRVTAVIPGATYSRSWAASDFPEERFVKTSDIADMVWAAWSVSAGAVVESIVIRPMDGDI